METSEDEFIVWCVVVEFFLGIFFSRKASGEEAFYPSLKSHKLLCGFSTSD